MRTAIVAVSFAVSLALLGSPAAALNNPVPFLNNPVLPAAAVPGGPAFALTVYGAGFVSGATLHWNGSARATTFVSATELTASILATDIATEGIAVVTVTNPSPGGGVSNAVLFSVTSPVTTIGFTQSGVINDFSGYVDQPSGLIAEPNPADGVAVVAVSNAMCSTLANCTLDAGTIAINSPDQFQNFLNRDIEDSPQTIVGGDFNGDGILDYVTLGAANNPMTPFSLWTALGISGGNIQTLSPLNLPFGASALPAPVAGDFNRDGHLDLVISGPSLVYFLPGNGDGTFGTAVSSATESAAAGGMAAGDFNGDGILDLAVTNPLLGAVSILIGNGDGTFKSAVDYNTGTSPAAVIAGDFNGDGKLDLAVLDGTNTTVSILLGNGDGTFQSHVEYPAGISTFGVTLGDFNGDGILDLAISDTQCTNTGCPASGSVNFLLGNGNGTFQSQIDIAVGSEPEFIGTTTEGFDTLAPIGRAGFAVADYLDNAVLIFAPIASTGGSNPAPSISNLSPANVIEQSGAFTLTVNGSNFVSSTTVSFNGQAEPTTFVSASQVTAGIPASAILTSGNVVVQVVNPAPGGGESSTVFSILLLPPTISSISPSGVIVGSPGFTLTVGGTNFVNGTTVNVNGSSRAATFIGPGNLTVPVLASDLVTQGTINISVTNPFGTNDGGGGTSSSLPLSVLPANTQPGIVSLYPSATTAGGPAFTLLISGTAFSPSSTATFGGSAVTVTYANPGLLQAAIPASAIASAGSPAVTVSNPGSSPSAAFAYTVTNPVPDVGQLEPTSVPAGSASTQVSVFGVNFVPSSVVQVNGSARPTTYTNAVTLVATLPASDFAHSGTLNITVITPGPGGGTTRSLPLLVTDYNVAPPASGQSVTAGQSATYSLAFNAVNGTLAESVSFSASGLPTGAQANFMPASLAAGSSSTAVMLSITTTPHSATSVMAVPRNGWPRIPMPYGLAVAFATMCLAAFWKSLRAGSVASRLAVVAALAAALGVVACGSSGSSATVPTNPATGTPAGTYTITVNATSSAATVSTKVMLTVQ